MKLNILIFISFILTSFAFAQGEKFGYEVTAPEWLKTIETKNPKLWGGTMPEVEGIKNAILITAYEKSEFKSFDDFIRIYITGNTFGKETLFSKQHIWYGSNEKDFKHIEHGVSSRVFTFYKNHIYHNQFVLIETSKCYLWIQFCATPETYDINLPLFDKFMEELIIK